MKKIILLLSILFISVLHADTVKIQKTQVPGYYRFMVGSYEVTSIYDGYSNLPLDTYKGIDAANAEAIIKKEYSHIPQDVFNSSRLKALKSLNEKTLFIFVCFIDRKLLIFAQPT